MADDESCASKNNVLSADEPNKKGTEMREGKKPLTLIQLQLKIPNNYNAMHRQMIRYLFHLRMGLPKLQILGWSILDHQSRNGFRMVRMYYPNGDMHREMGINEGVLDLCVRKEAKEDVKGDVNGNGYVDNPNGYYKDNCEYKNLEMVQHYRYPPVFTRPEPDPSPVIKQDEIIKDEVPSPGSSTSPNSGRPYLPDSAVGSRFVPLPTTISTITTRNGKPTRPFKAYPKEFLPLASSEGLLDDSNQRYMEFRRQFLTQLHASTALASNKNMKRPVQSDSPNQLPSSSGDAKDQAYWERRRKNNEAAKKSRDARRAKEDEIAIRAAFLERENIQLKLELASLRSETDRLRCMLYTS